MANIPVQWQNTKPAQINDGTDTKTEPASKIKGQCAWLTPNTLILAKLAKKMNVYYTE